MAFALAFSVTSCNKGDDPEPVVTDYAKTAAGTYNGKIDVPAMPAFGIPAQTIDSVSIAITYVGENSAKLQMNQILPIAGQQIPMNVTCPVTTSDGGSGATKLSGNTTVVLSEPIVFAGSQVTQIPVVIDGTVSGNNASVNIKVMSMITVVFTGTK